MIIVALQCKPSNAGPVALLRHRLRRLGFLASRYIGWDRSRVQLDLRAGFDRLNVARVVRLGEELVQHALDRGLGHLRSGVAHVIVLEVGAHDGDAVLRTLRGTWNNAGISLEHRVMRRSEEHTSEL